MQQLYNFKWEILKRKIEILLLEHIIILTEDIYIIIIIFVVD